VEKIQISLKYDKNDGTLHTNLCTFMILRSLPLRMRNLLQAEVAEKIKTSILYSIALFPKIIPGNEIMLKNITMPDRPQITLQLGACALHAT
jgi:hypothetical protein